jgi:hypothetical protein
MSYISAVGPEEPVIRRYLCSELVTLTIAGQSSVVNLEEIWRSGAVIEAEENIPAGVSANLQAGALRLDISIERVEKHAYGYRVEVSFADAVWTPELFTPAHLTDLTSLSKTMRAPGPQPHKDEK